MYEDLVVDPIVEPFFIPKNHRVATLQSDEETDSRNVDDKIVQLDLFTRHPCHHMQLPGETGVIVATHQQQRRARRPPPPIKLTRFLPEL